MKMEPADFERQVIQRSTSVPVLVDFWAPWCGPCRVLGPVLERLAQEADGGWELVKVNTEENPDLAQAFNITGIPAVKLFVGGEVVDEFTGALPEPQVRRFLEQALPSPHREAIAQATKAIEQGALDDAARLLDPALQAEPGNTEARVLLAQAVLSRDPARAGTLLEGIPSHAEFGDRAESLRTLVQLSLLPEHPEALPAGKGRDQYLAAATALRSGDWAAALDRLIGVVDRDKAYFDDGARRACKAMFQVLGPRHPLTEQFFRAFSSALHA